MNKVEPLRLAELIELMPRNAEWQAEVVAALRELSRLRGQPCCKGLAPPDECKCLRGPTPAGSSHPKWLRQVAKEIAAAGHNGWGNTCTDAADAFEALERKCAAQREALESIRIFARDCIDTGHDKGALGNLYAITDLCDAMLAAAEGVQEQPG